MFRFILSTMFLAAILGCGGDRADKYMQEGFVHIQQQKYDEAIASYEKAIKVEPRAATAYNMMGMAYRFKYNQLGVPEFRQKEMAAFQKAVEIDPNNWVAMINLATDYFALRETDNEIALLTAAVSAYERSLRITQNQYDAAIAQRTDVLQAQTQLETTRANLTAMIGQRALLEHAIALLVGKAPADFGVAPAAWNADVPGVPLVVPSALLQRRPDIAAAERAVAAANAQIGIQRAAYFPSLGLSASYGGAGSTLPSLFRASNNLWSLGLSAAQTLFDAGAIAARVEGAQAARAAAVANYRQTVLGAFQAVEDELATSRSLAQQENQRRAASADADRTEQLILNQYLQGQVPYTSVVTAQVTALGARQTLSQLMSSRQAAAVALIQAMGGGWHAPDADETAAAR